jgi:hypothetical protein
MCYLSVVLLYYCHRAEAQLQFNIYILNCHRAEAQLQFNIYIYIYFDSK